MPPSPAPTDEVGRAAQLPVERGVERPSSAPTKSRAARSPSLLAPTRCSIGVHPRRRQLGIGMSPREEQGEGSRSEEPPAEDVPPDSSLMGGVGACGNAAAAYGVGAAGPDLETDGRDRGSWPAATSWIASSWADDDSLGGPGTRRRCPWIESAMAGGRWAVPKRRRPESIAGSAAANEDRLPRERVSHFPSSDEATPGGF